MIWLTLRKPSVFGLITLQRALDKRKVAEAHDAVLWCANEMMLGFADEISSIYKEKDLQPFRKTSFRRRSAIRSPYESDKSSSHRSVINHSGVMGWQQRQRTQSHNTSPQTGPFTENGTGQPAPLTQFAFYLYVYVRNEGSWKWKPIPLNLNEELREETCNGTWDLTNFVASVYLDFSSSEMKKRHVRNTYVTTHITPLT
jgi:hypothetical protein